MPAHEDAAPSFETVVLPHLDAAYNLARWLARDATLAEDIVQDAAERALRYFASFRGGAEPGGARAWWLRIVRNAAYDTLRGRGGGSPRGLEMTEDADQMAALSDPAPGPEALVALRQDLRRLDATLAALPAELRECLVLCELEGLSYREIASVTEVPIGTVMSRLWRARRTLLDLGPSVGLA